MGDSTIELLRYSGYAFAVFAVLLFILAVVLFFKFRIREVFYELSGKGKIKMTEKMTASYEMTGTLRKTDTHTGATEKTGKTGGTGELSGSLHTGSIQRTGQISHARKVSKSGKTRSAGLAPGFVIEKELVVVHTNERIQ